MDDVDLAVVAILFLQLGLDLRCVADEKKLADVRIFAQRHHRAGYKVGRTEIAAHRIQGDLHADEILRSLAALCKMKIQGGLGLAFDGEDLAPFIITARRTNSMTADGAAALRTLGQLRPVPAVGRFALPQSHLRSFAFRNSHVRREPKQEISKIQMAGRLFAKLQLVQRAPIRSSLDLGWRSIGVRGLANAAAFSIAARMRW